MHKVAPTSEVMAFVLSCFQACREKRNVSDHNNQLENRCHGSVEGPDSQKHHRCTWHVTRRIEVLKVQLEITTGSDGMFIPEKVGL